MPSAAVLAAVQSSPQGLATTEARIRLAREGGNVLIEAGSRSAGQLFLDQFKEFMILVLLAVAVVSWLIGDAGDALAILAVLAVNAAVGFVQEYRAERAMAALRALSAPTATVVRDGGIAVIPAAELVAGDLVRLEAGAIVPADLRLLEAVQLRVQESALTGESVPAEKVTALLAEEQLALGDRRNMAYRGTLVAHGRGGGVAVATGMDTELGRIAALLQETVAVKTPLQRRLADVGRRLALAALTICAVVFVMGLVRGESPLLMFLTAISLAVAAIPEGPTRCGNDLPGPRRAEDDRPEGAGPEAARRGDPGCDHLHLRRQDGNPDRQPDARRGDLLRRRRAADAGRRARLGRARAGHVPLRRCPRRCDGQGRGRAYRGRPRGGGPAGGSAKGGARGGLPAGGRARL